MDATTIARFWSKVDFNGPMHPVLGTRCWVWVGSVIWSGYGLFKSKGVQRGAHRYSWLIEYGVWPTPCCLHKCDNPPCIRPDHLFEGSNKENTADMISKGRKFVMVGEKHSNAKLTSMAVIEIRQQRGKLSQSKLSELYGVNQSTISRIMQGKRWCHS